MYLNLIVPNQILKHSSVSFWDIELIKKVISVIIPPLITSLCQRMSLSLNPFLSSHVVGHLFKRNSLGVELSFSVPPLILVPIYHFDGGSDGKKGEKEL